MTDRCNCRSISDYFMDGALGLPTGCSGHSSVSWTCEAQDADLAFSCPVASSPDPNCPESFALWFWAERRLALA